MMINSKVFLAIFSVCVLSTALYSDEPKPKKGTSIGLKPVEMSSGVFYIDGGKEGNKGTVGHQLDIIVAPTPSQALFLNSLKVLTLPHIQHVLNQISGQQHTADLFLTEVVNTRFIRRLYDPLRPLITKDLRNREWYDREREACCFPFGIDCYVETSGSRLSEKGNENSIGYKMDGAEVTVEFQKTFFNALTFGLAGSYEYDHINYNVGGTGNMNSVFGGIYGLYRLQNCYIFSDLAYGYTGNKLRRSVGVKIPNTDKKDWKYSIHSYPKNYQLTSYTEIGVDFNWEDLMIQPFFGVEVGKFRSNKITESGGDDLDLTIHARKRTLTSTRLGVHLTSDLPSNMGVSLDLAWNFRSTSCSNNTSQHFATFGTQYTIEGIALSRNYFDGAITLTQEIFCNLNCFGQFSGEMWDNSTAYCVLLGVEKRW